MRLASQVLHYVDDAAFVTLAAVCAVRWRRSRSRGAGWVAAAFSVVAGVELLNLVLPERSSGVGGVVARLGVALFLFFPYFLYRFTGAFHRASRPIEGAALGLTLVASVWALLVPSSGEGAAPDPLFVVVALTQWSLLTVVSATRLWHAGRGEPSLVRRRLRLLSVALLVLNVLIVVAGAGSSGREGSGADLTIEILALASVLLFFIALFPPPILRRAWRGAEETQFREAIAELMTATRADQVLDRLLKRIGIVGGRTAAIVDADGRVIARSDGPNGDVPPDEVSPDEPGMLRLGLRSGSLLVRPSPYTPIFGRDELGLLETLCALADLALERVASEGVMRNQAKLLDLAPDAILARDLDGRIDYWNEGATTLYGFSEAEAVGRISHELLRTRFPTSRAEVEQVLLRDGRWEGELTQTGRDGSTLVISSRWALRRDRKGRPVQVLVINTDITAQKAAARELERAREEAERASHAKSEFLSRMSHELRTPLNAILGFGQLLQMEELDPEQRDSVGEILKAGSHLLELINEVLEISRIEAGKLAVSIEPVPVHDLVAEALSLIRPLAEQRRLTLGYEHLTCESRHVRGDFQRIKQVLLNLLSNAVKYNVEGGSVHVSCGPGRGGRLRVSVSDTGPGIPPDRHDDIFEPFERLGAGQGVEGTGLGLALAKRLIEAMGGEIGVDPAVSEGSTFWFELALADDPADLPVPEPEKAGGSGGVAGPRLSALYIEDNLSNLKLVQRILGARPEVKLIPAMHGRIGLDLAVQHQPDVVLLDLQLPDMAGAEILRALKADEATRHIPVVVISADATRGQIQELLAAGAHAYLTKPLDVRRFLEVLDAVGDASLSA